MIELKSYPQGRADSSRGVKRRQVAHGGADLLVDHELGVHDDLHAVDLLQRDATSRTVGPSGVGRRKRTSKPAVMNGTGKAGPTAGMYLPPLDHQHLPGDEP